MIWNIIWYWLFAFFTIADVITTQIGLKVGLREANPIMAPFLDHIVAMKAIILLYGIVVIILYERVAGEGNGWVPVSMGAFVTFAVVVSNLYQIWLCAF